MGPLVLAALPFIGLLGIMGVSELMNALESKANSIDALRCAHVAQTISPKDNQRPYDWEQDGDDFDLQFDTFWHGEVPNV